MVFLISEESGLRSGRVVGKVHGRKNTPSFEENPVSNVHSGRDVFSLEGKGGLVVRFLLWRLFSIFSMAVTFTLTMPSDI